MTIRGLPLPDDQAAGGPRADGTHMSDDQHRQAFDELRFYTLAHSGPDFIHQHAVDAFAAQHADESDKPIRLAFGLIGLCLHVEQGYSGRRVQRAHSVLANRTKHWPRLSPPSARGEITVLEVVAATPGRERDEAIERWCRSVWDAWSASHAQVRELIRQRLGDS
jgi:hypothetical protein